MSTKSGRKLKYETEEQQEEAKRIYNKRYYDKNKKELKATRDMMKIKDYNDNDIKKVIELLGWERILKLMIE